MTQAAAPLLLLPGLMCDERIWKPQLREFAMEGASALSGYGEARSFEEMARIALASAASTFSLVGHSMGARVAIEVYRLAPHRVERLALLDTGIHQPGPGEADKRFAFRDIGARDGIAALVDAWLPPMVHPSRRDDDVLMAPLRDMAAAGGLVRYENQITALLARPKVESLLATITCPVLVGVGRQDEWSPVEQHREIVELVPHAVLEIFEDCGHMAPVEAPDQVNAALRSWLKRDVTEPMRQMSDGEKV